jgi:hypothetical protein
MFERPSEGNRTHTQARDCSGRLRHRLASDGYDRREKSPPVRPVKSRNTRTGFPPVRERGVEAVREPALSSWPRDGPTLARGTESKKRKEIRKVRETFGLDTLVLGQGFAEILLIEQGVEPPIHPLRQHEAGEICRKLDLDVDRGVLGHRELESSIVPDPGSSDACSPADLPYPG